MHFESFSSQKLLVVLVDPDHSNKAFLFFFVFLIAYLSDVVSEICLLCNIKLQKFACAFKSSTAKIS